MLKKNKQLIIGFVLGALLFTIIPVNATVQEYILKTSPDKFIVDGEEIVNEKLPMLKYGGYNYIPAATFREICDKIGVGFEWVGEKKEIRIDTNIKKPIVEKEPLREREDNMEIIEGYTEESGYNLLVTNRATYIKVDDIHDKYKGQYSFNPFNGTEPIYRSVSLINNLTKEKIVGIPDRYVFVSGEEAYINFDYFERKVLPAIEGKEGK